MHDKGFTRWPPHINLLYPFLEDRGRGFAEAAEVAAAAVADVEPFQVGKRGSLFVEGRLSVEGGRVFGEQMS